MRNVDRRFLRPPLQGENRVFEGVAEIAVERGERFIEQQHARIGRQHSRQRHPLLLPAGKLRGQAVVEAGQLHHLKHFLDPLVDFRFGHPTRTTSPNAMFLATVRCGKSA